MYQKKSTIELLEMLKGSFDHHLDLIDPEESEFRKGLAGGLRMSKMYVQFLIDEHWQVTVDKIIE